MTNYEAAKQLRDIIRISKENDCNVKEIDALDEEALMIAIQMLERRDDDFISRKEAIRQLKDCFADEDGIAVGEYWSHDKVVEVLDGLPSVTPKPKTGHWIPGEKAPIECDRCGYGVMPWNNTEYCPNCGCRMVEQQERISKE